MTACLNDRELLALSERAGTPADRDHLERCPLCSHRARALERDIGVIARVLGGPCPPEAAVVTRPRMRSIVSGAIAALLVLGLVGLWSGTRRWPFGPPESTDGVAALADLSANVFGEDGAEVEAATDVDTDVEVIASAFDSAGPCEWQPGGCDDETEPLY